MFSFRLTARIGAAIGALVIALPAAAGTLSPQLRALADSYRQNPESALTRALESSRDQPSPLFSPHVNAAGKVQVYMHFPNGIPPSAEALSRLGASRILTSRPLGVVQAWIPVANLGRAAALEGISHVGLPDYAYVKNAHIRPRAGGCDAVPTGLDINGDALVAENVAEVHAQGITGQGVKIGIISDGADCRSVSQQAGYLPGNIFIPAALAGEGDEGTAMLELVHALAPDALLGFCGPETSAEFLLCFDEFAQWGADVISDDLGFFPVAYNFSVFDSNGQNQIVAFANAHPNISLTTSGGNDRKDYYEADYFADTSPTSPDLGSISLSPAYTVGPYGGAANRSYVSATNFGQAIGKGDVAAMKVRIFSGAGLFADLTWNDPANGPYDDLDLFLLKPDGSVACGSSQDQWCASTFDQKNHPGDPNDPANYPLEFLSYSNNSGSTQTLYLVAFCFDCTAHGTNPLHIKLYGFMNGGGTFHFTTNGGISGHPALEVETATAAARFVGLNLDGSPKTHMEDFSDVGPFTYGDWTQAPQFRQKPDITGIDGVLVSGAGGFGSDIGNGALFFGTSAASPNVGAVIVLLRGAFPNAAANAAGWEQIIMDTASTQAIDDYSLNASGAGLVDAAAAASSLGLGITATITTPAQSPFSVDPNTDVSFAATCDYEGNDPATYGWTFGGPGSGAPPGATGLAPAPVQYANGGIYTATFTCEVDNQGGSDTTTIAVQAAATAEDRSLTVPYQTATTGHFQGSGIGGEQITYEVVSQPAHGTVAIGSSDSFTYTPDTGFSGSDSFTYDIDNGAMKSNTATVSVTVQQAP
ncbi:MAG: Ig-like domain-containing protein, partial [Gammaproteobacteria bacterium]|nr:Ig-like domain-containing protein [Gammaproteobacteria bacterium]